MNQQFFQNPQRPAGSQPSQNSLAANKWRILTEIPYVKLVSVVVFSLVVLVGLIRSLAFGSSTPMLLPLLATVLSAVSILLIDLKEKYGTTYMRIGFHAGLLIFLTSYPILAPESMPNIDEMVRYTAGLALVLCVLGFEIGYWTLRSVMGNPRPKSPFLLVANNYSWVTRLLFVGIAMYCLFLVYAVASSGRSLYSIFFVLRGELLVNIDDAIITPDANRNQLAMVMSYGRYLAAAAATILILAPNPFHFPNYSTISWLTLAGCAFIGLNSASGGSRSSFLLSSVPFLTTLWIYAGTNKTFRQVRPLLAIGLVCVVIFGFQYLSENRDMGKNVQDEQIGFNIGKVDFTETKHLMAFSIYRDYEVVIGGFPDKEPFQNGASIVPIILGWVPRRFWEDKPYPFTSVANRIHGYKVEVVSIACGFPGEGYGNFGLMGAMIWGAAFGAICGFADFRMNNMRPGHPLSLVMRGMMAVWAAIIVRGGTAEMFYMGLFPIGFMWICLYFSDPRKLKST